MKLLTYMALHKRLATSRGPASEHTCPCGQPAVDWAYQHNADQEYCDAAGRPYSLDFAHYVAMCRDCHRFLDSLPRPAKPAPIVVLESEPDPEYWTERNAAGAQQRGQAMRERYATDEEWAEAMRENSQVNGLAMQQRHLEKLAEDPEYAARSKASWLANLATANEATAARRAADPEFDAKMRAMHQEVCRKVGSATMKMRRRCGVCGVQSTPPGMARHQRASGHEGWTDAREDGGSDLRS